MKMEETTLYLVHFSNIHCLKYIVKNANLEETNKKEVFDVIDDDIDYTVKRP